MSLPSKSPRPFAGREPGKRRWRLALAGLALLGAGFLSETAQAITPPDTSAEFVYLMDAQTGAVLFEKNADVPMGPASMTKIMTTYLVFERLKDGRLSMDTPFRVSEKAWRKGGSKMFVEVGKDVTVGDLLRGVIIQSGNDASIVIAEGISGSEEAFAAAMTRKAEELGMLHSRFRNSTGWPDPDHVSSAHDLAILARAMILNFPEYYHLYSGTEFTFSGIRQTNRNPLLYSMGADGLKTGHTEASGYGLTASIERDGRRLILVAHGMESERERAAESRRLLEWGLREFDNYKLFSAGEVVDHAGVWLGDAKTVPLVVEEDVTVTLPRRSRREMSVTVAYQGPVPAPVTGDSLLGTVTVSAPDFDDQVIPLAAGKEIAQLGAFGKLSAALGYLMWGQ
ncbi:MAG: D-alanyl-D-alanine carboxypeptidase family protein [Alphaproteobacteria bacterium]